MILSLLLAQVAQAQQGLPTDDELSARLLEDIPSAQASAQSVTAPWWLWPAGLLGAVGVAGAFARRRTSEGPSGDINVLSRAGLSRTASLAMIEVEDADGSKRRMLIGVGGGAPRLVADLTAPAAPVSRTVAAEVAASDWFEEPEEQPAAPAVGQRLSVTTPEAPEAPARSRRVDATYRTPRAAEAPKKTSGSLNLVAEVLAERGHDERAEDPADGKWSDPWAKNFEALLGRRSV